MFKNILQKNMRKGFTLIETLVAITILMVSIGGPMVLVGNGINVSRYSRDQVIAFYLAQDAIETLRFIRDANRIEVAGDSAKPWDYLSGLTQCQGTDPNVPVYCDIDTKAFYTSVLNNNRIDIVSGLNVIETRFADESLKKDSDGYYGHQAGVETKFKRKINIIPRNGSNGVPIGTDISVTVTWDNASFLGTKTFTVKESLYNWY